MDTKKSVIPENPDINKSISKLSHIHSITADYLENQMKALGMPNFVSSHGNILFQLSRNPKMKMQELAQSINRDKSTTTVLVRKLENEGLVKIQIDETDKRNRNISLTEKGQEYNNLTASLSKNLLETFYKDFTSEEKETFCKFLERIEKNFLFN